MGRSIVRAAALRRHLLSRVMCGVFLISSACTGGSSSWRPLRSGPDSMGEQLDSNSITLVPTPQLYGTFAYRSRAAFGNTYMSLAGAVDCGNLRDTIFDVSAWDTVLKAHHNTNRWTRLDPTNEVARRTYHLVCRGMHPTRWIEVQTPDSSSSTGAMWLDLNSMRGPWVDTISAPDGRQEPAKDVIEVWVKIDATDSTLATHTLMQVDVGCDVSAYRTIAQVKYKKNKVVNQEPPSTTTWQSIIPGSLGETLFAKVCAFRKMFPSS